MGWGAVGFGLVPNVIAGVGLLDCCEVGEGWERSTMYEGCEGAFWMGPFPVGEGSLVLSVREGEVS